MSEAFGSLAEGRGMIMSLLPFLRHFFSAFYFLLICTLVTVQNAAQFNRCRKGMLRRALRRPLQSAPFRYFAVGSADSLVSLWDIKEMLCVRTFVKLEWPVRTLSFNHTGEYIASASEDLFIDIANVETGRSVHQIPCRAAMNSVEWNPKSNLLAYAGDDKNKYQTDEGVFRIFGFQTA